MVNSIDQINTAFTSLTLESRADSPFSLRSQASPPPDSPPPSPPPERVVGAPLANGVLKIDADFLASDEGKLITRSIKWLIYGKGRAEKTVEEVYATYNQALEAGNCYGQAQTFLLVQALPNLTQRQIKINILFFQILSRVHTDIIRLQASLQQRHKALKQQLCTLQLLLHDEKQALHALHTAKAPTTKRARLHRSELLQALTHSRNTLAATVALYHKHHIKFRDARAAATLCLQRLGKMYTDKYCAANYTEPNLEYRLHKTDQSAQAFSELVIQKIESIAKETSTQDYVIGFFMLDRDNKHYGHALSFQLGSNLYYNSHSGITQYTSAALLLEHLQVYLEEANCSDVIIFPKTATPA